VRQRRYDDIIKTSGRSTTLSKGQIPEARRDIVWMLMQHWHDVDQSQRTNRHSNDGEVTLTFNQRQTTVFAFTITRTSNFTNTEHRSQKLVYYQSLWIFLTLRAVGGVPCVKIIRADTTDDEFTSRNPSDYVAIDASISALCCFRLTSPSCSQSM